MSYPWQFEFIGEEPGGRWIEVPRGNRQKMVAKLTTLLAAGAEQVKARVSFSEAKQAHLDAGCPDYLVRYLRTHRQAGRVLVVQEDTCYFSRNHGPKLVRLEELPEEGGISGSPRNPDFDG